MLTALALVLALQTPSAKAPKYPAYNTTKELYAEKDVRGKAAPKLEVERWLTGAAPKLEGKVLILDFWATWCPPCRETIPELNGFAKKFAKDLVVIGISKEKPEVVQAFMKKTPFAYNLAIDTQDRTSSAIGVRGIPHVLVVTPDGIVRWQGFPLDEKDPLKEETIAQIIAANKASAK